MRLMSIVEATPATGLGRGSPAAWPWPRRCASRDTRSSWPATSSSRPRGPRRGVRRGGRRWRPQPDRAGPARRGPRRRAGARGLRDLPRRAGRAARRARVRTACFRDTLNGSHSAAGVDLVIAPEWRRRRRSTCRPDGSVLASGPDYAPVRLWPGRRPSAASSGPAAWATAAAAGPARGRARARPCSRWPSGWPPATSAPTCSASAATNVQRRRAEVQSTRRVRILATGWRPDLPRLVADHDLVVSFGRRFSWEVACIGTPMALLPVSPADVPALEATADLGAAIWLGRPGDAQSPAGRLRTAMRDGIRRREVATRAGRLVDGKRRRPRRRVAHPLIGPPAQPPDLRTRGVSPSEAPRPTRRGRTAPAAGRGRASGPSRPASSATERRAVAPSRDGHGVGGEIRRMLVRLPGQYRRCRPDTGRPPTGGPPCDPASAG